jgi:hypothetical protein
LKIYLLTPKTYHKTKKKQPRLQKNKGAMEKLKKKYKQIKLIERKVQSSVVNKAGEKNK